MKTSSRGDPRAASRLQTASGSSTWDASASPPRPPAPPHAQLPLAAAPTTPASSSPSVVPQPLSALPARGANPVPPAPPGTGPRASGDDAAGPQVRDLLGEPQRGEHVVGVLTEQ